LYNVHHRLALTNAGEQPTERRFEVVVVGLSAHGRALSTREGMRRTAAVEMDAPVIDTYGAGSGLSVGYLCSHVLDGYPKEQA
jgi:hypothetical protein